jgi:uncharacterized flavoprotein (TIGR03862 family)
LKKGKNIAVIGGGPAGLMAAETALDRGGRVTLYDAMPSVGRKFLVAGKSGLNLTFDEPLEPFLSHYRGTEFPADHWRKIITSFDNTALRKWAEGLGIKTFAASSGKVFPTPIHGTIRAAPLLRRWIERLRKQGIIFKTRHRWQGIGPGNSAIFEHSGKTFTVKHDAIILALGGGSWSSTGSDGNWVESLTNHGVRVDPLTPANCGWETRWPEPVITEAEGLPIKNILLYAGDTSSPGELVVTRYGLEGGPIYRLGPEIRAMESPEVVIDFKPNLSHAQLVERMGKVRRNFTREARRRWKLEPAACSLLKHLPNRGPWTSVEQLANEVKQCRIPLTRPRPLEEAISSAGGIHWDEIDNNLMLKKLPSVYAAGEMLNWEAPTGGYLMQGCFATGRWAGIAAATS